MSALAGGETREVGRLDNTGKADDRMAKTYRAAAIGDTGRGGYGHGLHLPYRDMENVELTALADPDEAGRHPCSCLLTNNPGTKRCKVLPCLEGGALFSY